MAWSPDPELHQMFLDELDQRSGRLASGSDTMAAGDVQAVDFAAMRREGHTIKGTARVMGYEAIGLVAQMIESIWDAIAAGDVDGSAELGTALSKLCVELELAGRENPQTGTADLRAAVEAVAALAPTVDAPALEDAGDGSGPQGASPDAEPASELVEDVEVLPPAKFASVDVGDAIALPDDPVRSASRREPGSASDTLPVSTGPQLSAPGSRREPPDLPSEYEAVIEAIDGWARDGTVIVNAGRLYRLINRITATRSAATELAKVAGNPVTTTEAERLSVSLMAAVDALQEDVLGLASLPLTTLTGSLPQLVTYLSKKLGKNIELEVAGDRGVVIDRQVLEAISEPIRQLIVNSIYHGLEVPVQRKAQRKPTVGSLTVDVKADGRMLELVVADDGNGVDWDVVRKTALDQGFLGRGDPSEPEDLTPILFEPGFSTGALDGGKGNGLAKLAAAVERLHGRVQFQSWTGDGTRVTVRVPAWQSLHRVLIVSAGGMRWAIPEAAVERSMSMEAAGLSALSGAMQMEYESRLISVRSLSEAAGLEPSGEESDLVILSHRIGTAAVAVDAIEGTFDVAVTELASIASGPDHIDGIALVGAGQVVLVVDAGRLIERARLVPGGSRGRARVLVAEDGEAGKVGLSSALSSSGFSTSVAGTAGEALNVLGDLDVDAVVVDFSLSSASAIALVEEVRRHDKHLPIAMISAGAGEDDRVRAKKAGVDRFFDRTDYHEGDLTAALWELLGE